MKPFPTDQVLEDALECPECGSTDIETTEREDTFQYGGREKPFTVTARIPVHTCRNCAFTFIDGDAETLRHEAACRQLGVMSPPEIVSIRDGYGMTQSAFADLTRLGVATLSRWERGVVIQNEAYDQFLYLLQFPENMERLRQRRGRTGQGNPSPLREPPRLRTIADPEKERPRAACFVLVLASGRNSPARGVRSRFG
jgi:putative zinc finger/helix-turn-helix YgiT family protein